MEKPLRASQCGTLWFGAMALLLAFFSGLAQAATLPSGFVEKQIATPNSPVQMDFAPDGRLFICEKGGTLRIVKNDVMLSTPFLTVNVDTQGERGLLGVAFDPNFATNGFVYVYYTATTPAIHNRVSRFTAMAGNPDVADPNSEVVLFDAPNLVAIFHNGGGLHVGPDGKLYFAMGENKNSANAQSLNTTLGKVNRINPDGTIPTDNPFFNQTTGKNRAIWAMGLRNPFTFAFDPMNGRMFINDVGEATTEEINDGKAGANYGWPTCEGACGMAGFTDPIFQYPHGPGCAITGGTFYNPPTPSFGSGFVGRYFFGDLCAGTIRVLNPATKTASGFASGIDTQVDVKVSSDGALYYLTRGGGGGQLFKVTNQNASQPPVISVQPTDQTVSVGASVTFSVRASGTAPITFQWQRNGMNIPLATAQDLTFTTVAGDNGALFRCVVSNSGGSVTSNAAKLTVITDQPPVPTITLPVNGTMYSAGDTIQFAGDATDQEDGTLPASNFAWTIVFHHQTHTHPFLGPLTGIKSGSFTIPIALEVDPVQWFRIHLVVTDSAGLSTEVIRDIFPRKANITLATNPASLQLTLDGQPVATPVTVLGVVGVQRTLGAPSPQSSGSNTFNFLSWSDGGAATHNILTPAIDTTFTANFNTVVNPCVLATAGDGFHNTPFPAQTGTFTAQFDATPSASPINSTIELSAAPAAAHTDSAVLVRFNPSGNIDARNGGVYAANATIPYAAGVTQHFRVVVNVPAHTYSVFVSSAGGAEQTVGTNFAFRTEQATASSLSSWADWVNATPAGSNNVCNFAVAGAADFALSATPASQSVTTGGSTSYTVSVAPVGAFNNDVALSVTGLPAGATGTFTPPAILGGSGSSTLNISTSSSTPAGTFTLTITGMSGGVTHTSTVMLTVTSVPNFSLSATPASRTVTVGSGTSYTVAATPSNGFASDVALSVSGLPAGTTATFNPAAIAGGSGSSTLTVTTSNSTPAGTSTLTITGSGGGQTHTTSVMLVVQAPNTCVLATAGDGFHNTPFPAQTGTFTAQFDATPSASPINSTIELSAAPAAAHTDSAVLVRFNPSGNIDARNGGVYAANATIPYAAGVTQHFRVVVNVPAHTYSVFVSSAGGAEQTVGTNFAFRTEQATASSLSSWADWVNATPAGSNNVCNFVVSGVVGPPPDFSLGATPASSTVTVGGTTSYNATVTPANGFTGAVSLGVSGLPSGATASFNPVSISGGSGSSTLSVSTSSTTPVGTFTLTITAMSGSLSHTAMVTLVVNAVSGTPVAQINSGGPAVTPFSADAFFSGGKTDTVTAAINTSGVTNPAPAAVYQSERWGGDAADNPAPFSYTFSNLTAGASYTVRLHFAEIFWTAAGQRKFNVAINGTAVLTNFDIIAAAGAANKAIVKEFTTTATSTGTIGISFTVGTADAPKISGIEIIPAGPAQLDFSLSANPSSQTITAGNGTSYTVSVGALNGFSGAVNLSVSGLPTSATASFTPASVSGSGSSTLNITTASTTPAGTSTLTITGTSGSSSHSANVSLVVNAAGGGGTTTNMMVTWFGVPDNSPPGKVIAFPIIHSQAGGTGTFADPITFATDTRLFAPGSIVYLPMVKKYFIMEDLCTSSGPGDQGPGCVNDFNNGIKHIDMWAGGDTTQSVITCEDNLTRNSTPVISNPPGNLEVSPPVSSGNPIFDSITKACFTPFL